MSDRDPSIAELKNEVQTLIELSASQVTLIRTLVRKLDTLTAQKKREREDEQEINEQETNRQNQSNDSNPNSDTNKLETPMNIDHKRRYIQNNITSASEERRTYYDY